MYGDLYNLEATPAESTTYRLAKHDVERYPDIITASGSGKTPYYTNSSHLPVGYTDGFFERWTSRMSCRPCIPPARCSTPSGEKLPDWKAAAYLVRNHCGELQAALLHRVAHLFHL